MSIPPRPTAPGLTRRDLYAPLEPYASEHLKVSDLHTIYVEQAGNPEGLPAIALHGGPGGGVSPEMRRFFDPRRYRMVLFDQRGCGRSTPFSELSENTTWHLVADIEKIRAHLGISRWLVFGGSWGTTLALAYAATHPERVAAMVLRGIFLMRRKDVLWFYQSGASEIFPDAFDRYVAPIPPEERHDLIAAFQRRLNGPDAAARQEAARAWARWEGETITLAGPSALPPRFKDDHFADAFARIEAHYFAHLGFFERDGWLLDQVKRFRHVPARIVHGRYDVCTPLSAAWELVRDWPEAQLDIIGDAGHSSLEPGIVDSLVRATDYFALSHRW